MPFLTEEYEKTAKKIFTPFLGDPSFFAYNGEDPEPEDPEAPPVERFREVHRLAHNVNVCASIFISHSGERSHSWFFTYRKSITIASLFHEEPSPSTHPRKSFQTVITKD